MEQDQLLQKAFSFADAMKVYKVCAVDCARARLFGDCAARLSAIVDTNAESTPLS